MKAISLRRAGLIAALCVGLGYFGWTRLTWPLGEQAVQFTPAHQQCGTEGLLRYCVHRAVSGVNGDVVYHLHGRNLEAEIWNDPTYFTALVQGYWQGARVTPPTVVTLSYGPVWLLTPKGKAEESGLLDAIWPHIMAIEDKIGSPRRRLLMGESMGGLNALVLGLSRPQYFDKVAALCPGVYVNSPFDSFSTIKAAMTRTGADPKIALGIWQMARRYISDESEWHRVAPLKLIEGIQDQPARPSIYLSCGLYDRYGNFEGAELLARRAKALGLQTEWHPIYGGHCATDVASLGQFLIH